MTYQPFTKPSGKPGRRAPKYAKREKMGQAALPGLDALTERQKSNLEAGNAPSRDADAPMGGWGRAKRQNAGQGTLAPTKGKPKGGT